MPARRRAGTALERLQPSTEPGRGPRARWPRTERRRGRCSARSAASPTTTCRTSRRSCAQARVERAVTSSRGRSCDVASFIEGARRDRAARGARPRARRGWRAAPPRCADASRRGRGHPPRDPALGRGGGRRLARGWPRSAARWPACARSSQSVMESFLRGKDAERRAAGQAHHHAQRPLRAAAEGRAPRADPGHHPRQLGLGGERSSSSPCPRSS